MHFGKYVCINLKHCQLNLPNNKAYGLYSSPVKLLKLAKSIISVSSTEIFNKSILTGVYPAKLRYAKIVPVFKSEDETLPENYRPISLLPFTIVYLKSWCIIDLLILLIRIISFAIDNMAFAISITLKMQSLIFYTLFGVTWMVACIHRSEESFQHC